mgnify:CR=1 FL=1
MNTQTKTDWLYQFEKALDAKCRELFPENYSVMASDKKEETPLQRQQRILREKYGDKKKTPARKGGE